MPIVAPRGDGFPCAARAVPLPPSGCGWPKLGPTTASAAEASRPVASSTSGQVDGWHRTCSRHLMTTSKDSVTRAAAVDRPPLRRKAGGEHADSTFLQFRCSSRAATPRGVDTVTALSSQPDASTASFGGRRSEHSTSWTGVDGSVKSWRPILGLDWAPTSLRFESAPLPGSSYELDAACGCKPPHLSQQFSRQRFATGVTTAGRTQGCSPDSCAASAGPPIDWRCCRVGDRRRAMAGSTATTSHRPAPAAAWSSHRLAKPPGLDS